MYAEDSKIFGLPGIQASDILDSDFANSQVRIIEYRRGMFAIRRTQLAGHPKEYKEEVVRVHIPELHLPDPVPGVVFVYGANRPGIHGRGAALTARQHYGAKSGEVGWMRDSYGIVTKETPSETAEFHEIDAEVCRFLRHVRKYGGVYLVTRIGCGLARYTDADIAPLFDHAPSNCILPYDWQAYLPILALSPRVWHLREPDNIVQLGFETTGIYHSKVKVADSALTWYKGTNEHKRA